jgi:hypothetical protein
VTKAYAKTKHLTIGGHLSVKTPAGAKRTLVVPGIYDPPEAKQLLGDVSMTQQAFDASGVHQPEGRAQPGAVPPDGLT